MTVSGLDPDFTAWDDEFSPAGGCSHPIRLRGNTSAVDLATGEKLPVFDTANEAFGVVHVPCGSRLAEFCPHCSQVYKRDAWQIITAGLSGGKGVPGSIAEHPCVFATFTAPSFGPVHSRREKNGQVRLCRPRRDRDRKACPHGRVLSCGLRHSPDDPRIGQPMCPDCYQYEHAVTWNAGAPDLWRRFVTYLPRHLARVAGIPVKACRELVKPRFFKVAEYQSRGLVHYHAVIRLDANVPGDPDAFEPPAPGWTAELLTRAVKAAAACSSVRFPIGKTGDSMALTFGQESGYADVRVIRSDTQHAVSYKAVANYIAKYVTKSVGIPGVPNFRIRHTAEIDSLRCSAHHKRLIKVALKLGYGLGAHQFGFHGHVISKSRRYSVTFGYCRKERTEHRKAQRWPDGELDPWGRPIDERVVLVLKDYKYAGVGYAASDEHFLALLSADSARKD